MVYLLFERVKITLSSKKDTIFQYSSISAKQFAYGNIASVISEIYSGKWKNNLYISIPLIQIKIFIPGHFMIIAQRIMNGKKRFLICFGGHFMLQGNKLQSITNMLFIRVMKIKAIYEWYTRDGKPAGSKNLRGSAGVLYTAITALEDWARQHVKE